MTKPHSSWAECYDAAYERSFGEFYRQLTDATTRQVEDCVQPPARIVDFGAGTGRLSVPLASRGYEVVAVDPCKQMLDQISHKPGGDRVTTVVARMQDFLAVDGFDMAICVFTVLAYLLDEDSLDKSIGAAATALRPGGLLLIDIPSIEVFVGYHRHTPAIERTVAVSPQGDNRYLYEEVTTLHSCDGARAYTDSFPIRYWKVEQVMKVLASHGFSKVKDLSEVFSGAGSQYFLLKSMDSAEHSAPPSDGLPVHSPLARRLAPARAQPKNDGQA